MTTYNELLNQVADPQTGKLYTVLNDLDANVEFAASVAKSLTAFTIRLAGSPPPDSGDTKELLRAVMEGAVGRADESVARLHKSLQQIQDQISRLERVY